MEEGNESEVGRPRHYEFDEHEDAVFRELASAMKVVGTALLILGPLRVIFGLIGLSHKDYTNGPGQVVEGVSFFLVGNWTRDAAVSIARIVSTKGNDITHLISGMADLKKIYLLQRFVLLVALAAIALGLLVLALATLKP